MATTSPDNLWSPDGYDGWDLTVDLAAMQNSTQAAITNKFASPATAVFLPTMYFATKSELTAFATTDLKNGQKATVTSDSTSANNGEYVWGGEKWKPWELPDVSSLCTDVNNANWRRLWVEAAVVGGWVHLRCTYQKINYATGATYLTIEPLLTVPDHLKARDDVTILPGYSNATNNSMAYGARIAGNTFGAVNIDGGKSIPVDGTFSADVSWRIAG